MKTGDKLSNCTEVLDFIAHPNGKAGHGWALAYRKGYSHKFATYRVSPGGDCFFATYHDTAREAVAHLEHRAEVAGL